MTKKERLTEFTNSLKDNPRSISELEGEELDLVQGILTPDPDFNHIQKKWINLWWLKITPEKQDELNYKLSKTYNRISGTKDKEGNLLLSSDLLSDLNNTYSLIKEDLKSLKIIHQEKQDLEVE